MKENYFLWYLACPYSHSDKQVEKIRFSASTHAALRLMENGIFVFSPLTYTDPLVKSSGLGGDWDVWEDHDLAILLHCDGILLLTLSGFQKSTGVNAEIDAFKRKIDGPIVPINFDNIMAGEKTVLDSILYLEEKYS